MRTAALLTTTIATLASIGLPATTALAQSCELGWSEGLFPLAGVDGQVYATYTWDDGSGPAVYVGGEFTIAGSVEASNLAKWDGQRWTALGDGASGVVHSFMAFDDGNGEALYVGGEFSMAGGLDASNIARWDGSQWAALDEGVNGPVYAMVAEADRLYVGGEFSLASGATARNLAWWDGNSWSGPPTGTNAQVNALLMHDDGTGEKLFVGGSFAGVGGSIPARGIAAWDPATQAWSGVGEGVGGGVNALARFDDGDGVNLYAGGQFTTAGGTSIEGVAKWDGASWSGLGVGIDGGVVALTVLDDAGGSSLIAAGPFERAGGEFFGNGIARWDGSEWNALGFGLQGIFDFYPRAVAVLDSGDGPRVLAGGNLAGLNGIAQFEEGDWQDVVEQGRTSALAGSGPVAVLDFGGTIEMYFSGDFPIKGGLVARVGRWDGENVEALIGGEPLPGYPSGLAVFDDGSGPAIYASGMGTIRDGQPVMRWDGAVWSTVGDPPVLGSTGAMRVFDDGSGPALYIGGHEMTIDAEEVGELVRWDGNSWTAVGGGLFEGSQAGFVNSLEVHDDGSGPALFAAGGIGLAGGIPVNLVARWDGTSWTDAGRGLDGSRVHALEEFDSGDGPQLIATGNFVTEGGTFLLGLARWGGDRWVPISMDARLNLPGNALTTFDDGTGSALYVGGHFSTAAGVSAQRIARWDGMLWSEVDDGMSGGSVSGLFVFNDGDGPALFASGGFSHAGGTPSAGIARYGCQPIECPADLDGDGELSIFDFLAFQNLFDAGDLAADLDGDGVLTLFDFLSFQNAFDAGC